ncbi:MAG: RsmD family RNA methyltransferase [Planctomycetota bacterium]
MRIIAGELKRRNLESPPAGSTTRPMPDRVRTALFNLLRGHFEGERIFDGFAGVGTIGLEAVSRGAAHAVMVERDRRVAATLQRNADKLGVADRCEIVQGDALGPGALSRCTPGTHLVFFDPPYALVNDPAGWPRVKLQFERLIQRLDDTGFATLRTPWPFVHRADGEGSPLIDVSLDMAGAVGPETHVYRSTAIHLYMKQQPEQEATGDEP